MVRASMLLFFFVTTLHSLSAQCPEDSLIDQEVFTQVDSLPQFPGGEEKLKEYIEQNFDYSNVSTENDKVNTLHLNFVVQQNGMISSVRITKGVNASINREGIRLVKSMPLWKPGMKQGKKVNTSYNLPIKLKVK